MEKLNRVQLDDGLYHIDVDGTLRVSGGVAFSFEGICVLTEKAPSDERVVSPVVATPPVIAATAEVVVPSGLESYRHFSLKMSRGQENAAAGMAILTIKNAATGRWVAYRREPLIAGQTEIVFDDLCLDKNTPSGQYLATVKLNREEIYRKKITVKSGGNERFLDSRVNDFNPRDNGLTTLAFWDFGLQSAVKTPRDLAAHFNHAPRWGARLNPKFNNEEWQNFQPFDAGNFVLAADHLKIIAKTHGAPQKNSITSGALLSKEHFLPDGNGPLFMGVRCKIPPGKGMWPAWWMYPAPGAGRNKAEVDFFEVVNTESETEAGWRPTMWHTNAHINAAPPHHQRPAMHVENTPLSDNYHTWIAEWTMDGIKVYFDGALRRTLKYPVGDEVRGWGAASPAQMIINLAVGGGWPGPADDSASFPAELCVDWMGVWRV